MLSPTEAKLAEQNEPDVVVQDLPGTVLVGDSDFDYRMEVIDVFGRDFSNMQRYEGEIGKIIEFAKEQGAKNRDEVRAVIRNTMAKIGQPGFGMNPIAHLYQYIFLQNEGRQIQNRLKEMENGSKE